MSAQFSSVVHRGAEGSFTEIATSTIDGVAFVACGAERTPDGAILVGYVARDGAGGFKLTTWSGDTIAKLAPRGEWRTAGFASRFRAKVHGWECTIDGVRYLGRNGGVGLYVRLRRAVTGKS